MTPPIGAWALVTGASSGIGAAVATRLARTTGLRLLLTGRNSSRLEAVANVCRGSGRIAVTIVADLATEDGLSAVRAAMSRTRPLGLVVNSAGWGAFAPVESLEPATFRDVVSVNLTATYELCHHAATLMERSGGTIVNVSSDADTIGFAGAAAYCASKGGLLIMSRAIREDLLARGIRVCVVSPGRVDTAFNNKAPGMRPGALSSDEVAEVIIFAATASANLDVQEIRIESLSRSSR